MPANPSYTPDPALVELAARVLYESEWRDPNEPAWEDLPPADRESYRQAQRPVLAALATEGRLLPAGAEVRTEWAWDCARGGCWHGDEVKLPHLHEGDEKWVREVAPDIWPGGRPMRRWRGPWLPAPTETEITEETPWLSSPTAFAGPSPSPARPAARRCR